MLNIPRLRIAKLYKVRISTWLLPVGKAADEEAMGLRIFGFSASSTSFLVNTLFSCILEGKVSPEVVLEVLEIG